MLRRIHESSPSFCEGSGWGAPHPPVVVSARPPRGVLTIAGLTRSHAQGRPRTCACAGLTGVRRGGGARLTGERGTRFPRAPRLPPRVVSESRTRARRAQVAIVTPRGDASRGSAQTPRLRRTRGLSPGPQLSGLQSEVENLSPLGGTSF